MTKTYVFPPISTTSPTLKCVASRGVPGWIAACGEMRNRVRILLGAIPESAKSPQ